MAKFFYSQVHQAFVKQCSRCEEFFVGTKDIFESIKVFEANFAPSGGTSQMADGLQSRCVFCNSRHKHSGVMPADFKKMFLAQNGQCAICERELTFTKANVDHDHVHGNIRGLLCNQCNQALGLFKDNPATIRKAAEYLEKFVEVIPMVRRV